jgi:hypothetical protein
MKPNEFLTLVLAGLLVSFIFSGCTDDFEEINTNVRVLSELDVSSIGNMYASVQYYGFFMKNHQVAQVLFADHYCQYFANISFGFPSDRYVLVNWWRDFTWNGNDFFPGFYRSVAGNLADILEATDPVMHPGFEGMHALAQIWGVITYERIANYWGPIPYSQVNNGETVVPYDSEEDIYKSFLVTLDDALDILNANKGGNAYGTHDQIYGGVIDKWIIFANTLRLRIAIRISEVDPTLAQAEAEKAVSAGVMISNADNAFFQCTANSPHSMPQISAWNEFRMSAAMESVLKGYDDPRMEHYFSPAVADGEYRGLRNGYEIVDLANPKLHPDSLSRIGPQWMPVSVESSLPWEIILSPEAYFLRAEGALKGWNMGGTAEEFYNKGIEMSMRRWGIDDDAEIEAYRQSTNLPVATHDAPDPVSTVPVKFDTSDDSIALEQIATQKWLALYPDGWEAWADLRRRDLPRMYPRMASDNPYVGVDELMRRLTFPPSEYELNAAAVQDAITKLGGPDLGSTRLWWDPE